MKKYPEVESATIEWKETLPQKQPIYKTIVLLKTECVQARLSIKDFAYGNDFKRTEGA